ncbi:CPBP family intramembrane glutamic endopeptidase [Paraglaciecola sp.]|uniref:CPBP family intramembrane glutamic endopeptidase n=1 Tax=Paraglaciecola sp. TaxID=1920173 RepID=UPI003EF318DD
MQLTELLLIVSIFCMVMISVLDKSKQKIVSNKTSLSRVYLEGIVILWLPVFFLVVHLVFSPLSLASIGITWASHWQSISSVCILILIIVYFILSSFSLVKDEKSQISFAEQMSSLAWFMPRNKNQLVLFTLGLSVSAGVCEELIFRGYLLQLLTEYIGLLGAALLSSVIFGLCHLYQGWANVCRTGLIGLVFCGVYIFTETLIIPIILHIAMDVYGGINSYIARNKVTPTN